MCSFFGNVNFFCKEVNRDKKAAGVENQASGINLVVQRLNALGSLHARKKTLFAFFIFFAEKTQLKPASLKGLIRHTLRLYLCPLRG